MSTEGGEGTFHYGLFSALIVGLFIYGQLENH